MPYIIFVIIVIVAQENSTYRVFGFQWQMLSRHSYNVWQSMLCVL